MITRLNFAFLAICLTLLAATFADFWPSPATRAVETDRRDIVIVAGGDVLLDRAVRSAEGFKGDGHGIFSGIESVISSADLAFANLECPLTENCFYLPKQFCFRGDPAKAVGLARAGFDLMTLGNNHAYDCGRDAILDTIESLQKAGIKSVGAGPNFAEAMKPAIFDLAGRKIAIFSFTIFPLEGLGWNPDMPTTAFTHEDEMATAIRAIRDTVDKIIVILHWGQEYGWLPTEMQKKTAAALSEAGADVIVGHHPHIIEPCTRIGKTWVAYSLGNLVFDPRASIGRRTALMKIIISGSDGDIRVEFVPLEIVRCRPVPASPEIAAWIADRLTKPEDFLVWRVAGDSILARRAD